MTGDDWSVVAAVGQAAAAIAAAFGLVFTGFQMRAATRVADLQALQEFLRSATECEARLCAAESDAKKLQSLNEFLNFLEINATALNHGLFPNVARKQVVDKLCTSVAVLQENPDWHEPFFHAVTNSTTFLELGKFMRREKTHIAECTAELRKTSDLR